MASQSIPTDLGEATERRCRVDGFPKVPQSVKYRSSLSGPLQVCREDQLREKHLERLEGGRVTQENLF